MKQLLFLLLFPCLCVAQYQGNGNQKITLGEQTTADGLVFRGVLNDTALITPFSDTSAYIILDTVNNRFFHYKRNTNVWSIAGGSDTSLIAYVNTYGTQTVNGAKTFTSAVTATRFNPTTSTLTGTGMYAPTSTSIGFSTNGANILTVHSNGISVNSNGTALPLEIQAGAGSGALSIRGNASNNGQFYFFGNDNETLQSYINGNNNEMEFYAMGNRALRFFTNSNQRFFVKGDGEFLIGYATADDNGNYRLQVKDSVYVSGNVSASAYTTRSDYDLKDEIQNISYGINEVMQMQPVKYTYKSNGSTQLGFIAQDLGVITPEVVSFEDKMSVYYNALIPILTKAIQEQNTLIKALEQRILTLENK